MLKIIKILYKMTEINDQNEFNFEHRKIVMAKLFILDRTKSSFMIINILFKCLIYNFGKEKKYSS